MSDPGIHDSLPDDLFRNRIAAALRQLDLPESDSEIEAALDAVEPEPISDPVAQRILAQVRDSIATTSRNDVANNHVNLRMLSAELVHRDSQPLRAAAPASQNFMIVACVALLVIVGVIFSQFSAVGRNWMAKRDGDSQGPLSTQLIAPRAPVNVEKVPSLTQKAAAGELLTTGPREKRRVTLPDGSVLSMNEHTRVAISGPRRIKLLSGEVFVEVIPASLTRSTEADKDGRFVVETPQRQVTALGTKFVVKAEGNSTNVVVTQGKVKVSGVAEIIAAGQELIADLTESNSVELRPARRSAYVVEWVKDLMAAANSLIVPTSEHSGGTITVIDPQGQEMKLSLRKFHVDVHIEDGFARTTIDQTYFNHSWQQLEGTFRFPLPADASLSRLAMYVNGTLMEGGMVERDYGRNVFEQIRHTRRDPALLEWVDGSTFQMRVFPLEARQEKRILLSYTQRLANDYGKSVYRFPSGHNLEGVREWSTNVRIKDGAGTKWCSPSHLLDGRDEGTDLVISGREEHAALDRDLVLELGQETTSVSPNSDPVWSRFEQDGFQYLMVRLRPEWKTNVTRPQRHWVFLVENSADRNTVLAETQRQIAKVLLENSEHSDTFSIIRAGTQPDLFRDKPAKCSLDNVAAALDFMKEVAPIGALDLGQALVSVRQQAAGNPDSWIVHLGTGIPVLGERDQTTLIRQLPLKARYVGVAVGKRWSKPFMETAARQTGGLVAQINPDEAIAWRAFDLLSTLNAPRLTEITVSAPQADGVKPNGATPVEFLRLTSSVSHGQELAAVTRLSVGQPLPASIVITGKLNGEAYSQAVSVPAFSGPASVDQSVASAGHSNAVLKSGHLPRTWARLEIDRLVALGSAENKAQIIELSKAMYVMSPFTSLLVLETEAMYEQFKVDRGRKDHWAMYAAPAQIPVVAEPAAAQLTILDAAKERLNQAKARVQTAEKNYQRSVAEKRPASDLKRLERLRQSELADVRLLEHEIERIEKANAAAADPVRKAWESVILRRIGWQQGYGPLYLSYDGVNFNYWGMNPHPNQWNDADYRLKGLSRFGDLSGDLQSDEDQLVQFAEGLISPVKRGGYLSFQESTTRLYDGEPGLYPPKSVRRTLSERRRQWADVSTGRSGPQADFSQSTKWNWSLPAIRTANPTLPSAYFLDDDVQYFPMGIDLKLASQIVALKRYQIQRPGQQPPNAAFLPLFSVPSAGGFGGGGDLGWASPNLRTGLDISLQGGTSVAFDFDNDGDGFSDLARGYAGFAPGGRAMGGEGAWGGGRAMGGGFAMGGGLMPLGRPMYYVAHQPLWDVLRDLPSYAPGLQTWTSDRLAIAEQAMENKPSHGAVDPEARRLIEKARSLGWESIRLVSKNQNERRHNRVVIADGAGRFRLDREVSEGLKETVINDGTTLLHLYPEIGLGAKRNVSRFHQSAIQSVIPWYVPPVDDLSLNADVKFVGHQTVRITVLNQPNQSTEKPKDRDAADESSSRGRDTEIAQLAIELAFADDGRLVELRLMDAGQNKLMTKQTFAANGTIRLLDADGKVLSEALYERSAVEPPNLAPESRELVVLPMPYRSSESVGVTVPLNLPTNTADYAKLSDDDAMKLLATYFAEARQPELATFIEQRFAARGDHRIGFAVLLASVVPQNPIVANATQQHPDLPLAKFLEQFAAFVPTSNLNGHMEVGPNVPLLTRLCGAYNVYARWSTDRAATRERSVAEIDQELDSALRYVVECRSLDLGLRLFATIQDKLKQVERFSVDRARQLNAAASAVAADRDLPGFARQARIEWLLMAKDAESEVAAKKLFRDHLFDAIEDGYVPSLQTEVRTAFAKHFNTPDGQPCGPWVELVREAAQKLSTLDRPMSLILIARHCVGLGETVLAAEIVQMAIKGQDLKAKPNLNLITLEYAKEAKDWKLAEACVQRALDDATLQKQSSLWRDAARIAYQNQKFTDWIENLEKAYELEFAALPKTVNLEQFRQDYQSLFTQFEQRTEQLMDASRTDKEAFSRIVQRAATRWREIDSDDTNVCYGAAQLLSKLGQATAAWNYFTTPLAESPDLSSAWMTFANAMANQHRFVEADKAWTTAFVCESTNPEILLTHARFLQSTNQEARARAMLTTIVTGNWQPRFEGTKSQAQAILSGQGQ